jgi:hypothetical protein
VPPEPRSRCQATAPRGRKHRLPWTIGITRLIDA